MQLKITKLPKSEIEIEGEIEASVFESYYSPAIKHLGEHAEMDGFRKGKVPENILLQNISEIKILEEMAEMALAKEYPKMIIEEKLDVISRPQISITKLARNNPLGFKIKTAVFPDVKLADYKKIAKKIISEITEAEKNPEVTDEDMENTIMDIRKSRAPKKHIAEGVAAPTLEEVGVPTSDDNQSVGKGLEPELPELNDEFIQALGPFENVEDFKTKLRENIKLEKANQSKEKTRLKIIEQIIEGSELEVPEIFIDSEVNKILFRMESDITTMGLKFDDYLKHLNKSIEDLRTEFRPDGEKKAKLSLVLHEISKVEDLKPEETAIEQEVKMIMEHYKDADPERARAHVENVLTNEKIFQFLETQ